LETGDRVVQIGAKQRECAEQNYYEACRPKEFVELPIKKPHQPGFGFWLCLGFEHSGKKDGNQRATEKQRENGLNIDEIAGATEQFEQDNFHGFSFCLVSVEPWRGRKFEERNQGHTTVYRLLRKPGELWLEYSSNRECDYAPVPEFCPEIF
jgi:hypothetical protein